MSPYADDIKAEPAPPSQKPPWWYKPVDDQIYKVEAFLRLHGQRGGFRCSDIPDVPKFTPHTNTEVLLLAVYQPDSWSGNGYRRTFKHWWGFIVSPRHGYKFRREDFAERKSNQIHLARGIIYESGIRWVAFDPNAYQGKSPLEATESSVYGSTATLAHSEVLMAAAMFPKWATSWGSDFLYPNMSGLEYQLSAGRVEVPYLHSWDGGSRLALDAFGRAYSRRLYSSPTVRECQT